MAQLRTTIAPVIDGGRVSVIDNTLRAADGGEPCATVRVTFARERPISIPALPDEPRETCDPTQFPTRTAKAIHGRPWFMDAMQVRVDDDVVWFKLTNEVIAGAGPLARVLGPADWTHGLARPLQDVAADPNPNLTVQMSRPPRGGWIGVRARTQWQPGRGLGMGRGVLLDTSGEIGCVAMAVVLLPIPARR